VKHVTVQASDGTVMLNGTMRSWNERQATVSAAPQAELHALRAFNNPGDESDQPPSRKGTS